MTALPGYPCAVCRRSSERGHSVSTPEALTHFCSAACIRIWIMKGPDITHNERAAAIAGGNAGGEYLDEIGKTDLASLSPEEWGEFCARLFAAACDALRAAADDDIPF